MPVEWINVADCQKPEYLMGIPCGRISYDQFISYVKAAFEKDVALYMHHEPDNCRVRLAAKLWDVIVDPERQNGNPTLYAHFGTDPGEPHPVEHCAEEGSTADTYEHARINAALEPLTQSAHFDETGQPLEVRCTPGHDNNYRHPSAELSQEPSQEQTPPRSPWVKRPNPQRQKALDQRDIPIREERPPRPDASRVGESSKTPKGNIPSSAKPIASRFTAAKLREVVPQTLLGLREKERDDIWEVVGELMEGGNAVVAHIMRRGQEQRLFFRAMDCDVEGRACLLSALYSDKPHATVHAKNIKFNTKFRAASGLSQRKAIEICRTQVVQRHEERITLKEFLGKADERRTQSGNKVPVAIDLTEEVDTESCITEEDGLPTDCNGKDDFDPAAVGLVDHSEDSAGPSRDHPASTSAEASNAMAAPQAPMYDAYRSVASKSIERDDTGSDIPRLGTKHRYARSNKDIDMSSPEENDGGWDQSPTTTQRPKQGPLKRKRRVSTVSYDGTIPPTIEHETPSPQIDTDSQWFGHQRSRRGNKFLSSFGDQGEDRIYQDAEKDGDYNPSQASSVAPVETPKHPTQTAKPKSPFSRRKDQTPLPYRRLG
ncbi:MAG: hypothetical protein M1820_009673 [Bogoriella megaspora]|nr:MAG: hypothetical protein M1820_009673 [Bogoriella megaspora]